MCASGLIVPRILRWLPILEGRERSFRWSEWTSREPFLPDRTFRTWVVPAKGASRPAEEVHIPIGRCGGRADVSGACGLVDKEVAKATEGVGSMWAPARDGRVGSTLYIVRTRRSRTLENRKPISHLSEFLAESRLSKTLLVFSSLSLDQFALFRR